MNSCSPTASYQKPTFRRFKQYMARKHRAVYGRVLAFVLDRHPDVRGCNLVRYAENELHLAGYFKPDGFYGGMIGHAVLRMVKVFSLEGHSGGSASIVRGISDRVLAFQPLTPLTGAQDEWNEVGSGVFQNRRMSSIFMENGEAYWIDGRIFREPSGCCFTNKESRVPVSFPWNFREPEIVDVPGAV